MELRHLRYFLAVAEEEHFGRAAERLHVTRPAVSQIVADLEDALGIKLFERHSRGIRLSVAGQAFLPAVSAVLADLGIAIDIAKRAGNGQTGSLNVGYGSSALMHSVFHDSLKAFKKAYPGVTLELIELTSQAQVAALQSGRIHVGFGFLTKDQEADVECFAIQDEYLGIALPDSHPLARKRRISTADLHAEQFIVLPKSIAGGAYTRFQAACMAAGFEPEIVQKVSNNFALLTFVSAGMGVGFLNFGKNLQYPPNIVVKRLADLKQMGAFQVMWPKGEPGPVLRNFIDTVKKLSQ